MNEVCSLISRVCFLYPEYEAYFNGRYRIADVGKFLINFFGTGEATMTNDPRKHLKERCIMYKEGVGAIIPVNGKLVRVYNEKGQMPRYEVVEGPLIGPFFKKGLRTDLGKLYHTLSPVPKKVRGPVCILEMFSEKFDTHVYIFGEVHRKLPICKASNETIDMQDLIISEIVSTTNLLDIFIETPFIPRGYVWDEVEKKPLPADVYEKAFYSPDWKEELGKHRKEIDLNGEDVGLLGLAQRIIFCLQPDKKKCQFKNTRVHYSDARNLVPEMFRDFRELKDIPELITRLEKIPERIQKQIDNVPYQDVREYLQKFIDDAKKSLIDTLKKPKLDREKAVNEATLYMDAYLLGRMFRTFKPREGYSKPVRNAIVCCGDYHRATYEKILRTPSFGFVVRNKWENATGCVPIPGMLPMFRDHNDVYTIPRIMHQRKKFLEEHKLEEVMNIDTLANEYSGR